MRWGYIYYCFGKREGKQGLLWKSKTMLESKNGAQAAEVHHLHANPQNNYSPATPEGGSAGSGTPPPKADQCAR